MLEITIEGYDDLSLSEQEEASDNGCGKEYASYLRVRWQGVTIALESDAMEAEDVCMYRDLSWIKPLLMKVHSLKQGNT